MHYKTIGLKNIFPFCEMKIACFARVLEVNLIEILKMNGKLKK